MIRQPKTNASLQPGKARLCFVLVLLHERGYSTVITPLALPEGTVDSTDKCVNVVSDHLRMPPTTDSTA